MSHSMSHEQEDDLSVFKRHLEHHLDSRMKIESQISDLLSNMYPQFERKDLLIALNELMTDYVAHSQLVIFPCSQELQKEAAQDLEEESLDNAVGLSYLSSIVANDPSSRTAYSVLLNLFADRLQMENVLFSRLRNQQEKTPVIRPVSGLYSDHIPSEHYRGSLSQRKPI